MALIRKIEIEHFRSIKCLRWFPSNGLNCLIGPGDAGKSTVLDAIDWCLGARRSIPVSDSDFYQLDVSTPISITLTIGNLPKPLLNLETYGDFLQGFNRSSEVIEDEPGHSLETVLTLNLEIEGDLEPRWRLLSDRSASKGIERNLIWKDKVSVSPLRLGASADFNLSWRKGSILSKFHDERPDASQALSSAVRQARKGFDSDSDVQPSDALAAVKETADDLGIEIGTRARALLDAHSISLAGGSIALHNDHGVPLRGLGLGSTRLLIAGIQRKVTMSSSIVLVDELENGLEPHRIIRFLGSLGAKTDPPPQQVFATSHSPIVLRELSHSQLGILRFDGKNHSVQSVPNSSQGTLRSFPEPFLAPKVLICEGASEIGFIRGFDQFHACEGQPSIFACGVALLDGGGGTPEKLLEKATPFADLGYQTAVFLDADVCLNQESNDCYVAKGGQIFTWEDGHKLETAIIQNSSAKILSELLCYALQEHDENTVEEHIKTASSSKWNLGQFQKFLSITDSDVSEGDRDILARACTTRNTPWFKSIRQMEYIAKNILAPQMDELKSCFKDRIEALFGWARNDSDRY